MGLACVYYEAGLTLGCLCGGACQAGRLTRRYMMQGRRLTWTHNMALGSLSRLRERFTRLEVAHPLTRMRIRQQTRTSLMTTCVPHLKFCVGTDASLLGVRPLSGCSLCWHSVMGMYHRPFRQATVMMSRPVRTTSRVFPSVFYAVVWVWVQRLSHRLVCTSLPGTDFRLVSSARGICSSCLQRIRVAW